MTTAPQEIVYPQGFPRALVAGRSLSLSVFVPGAPVEKQRHRARVVQPHGKKPFVQFYPDKKSADYEEFAGQCMLFQLKKVELEGVGEDFTLPVRDMRILASLRFNVPRPKTVKRTHMTVKPDIDNLAKSILDALVQGGVIQDDNCITDLVTLKRYADEDHPEGVEVELTCLPV